ncbi:MAG: hypothetical protein B5M52_02145 [Helicobacteraceae bacterium 4484_230]|nr:MAG: hypothetical protein B5M52_02145 [Helicobacteraceae bacterium 4484_230]
MNKREMLWLYFHSISLALRVGVFEQFVLSVKIFWAAFILFLAALGYVVSLWVSVLFILLGILLYKQVYSAAQRNKFRLLRKGDLVEYMLPDGSSPLQEFRRAKVRHRLNSKEVAAAKLFTEDEAELYEQFFLVDTGEKNIAIPFEWIMGIEFEES